MACVAGCGRWIRGSPLKLTTQLLGPSSRPSSNLSPPPSLESYGNHSRLFRVLSSTPVHVHSRHVIVPLRTSSLAVASLSRTLRACGSKHDPTISESHRLRGREEGSPQPFLPFSYHRSHLSLPPHIRESSHSSSTVWTFLLPIPYPTG